MSLDGDVAGGQGLSGVAVAEASTPDAPPRENAAPKLLEVTDLHVEFKVRHHTIYAVNGVSLSVDADETLAIIGESGSGKTVASRAILSLLPEYAAISGSARFNGKELLGLSEKELRPHRGADIAMIFQDSGRSLNPTMRVGVQIAGALRTHFHMSKDEAKDRAIELLGMVRMPAASQRYHEYPHQLSGGMRQRVMTAIALSCNPKVLIADEATTALDVTTQAQIMELLLDLQAQFHMGLIMISHDMGLAASFTDRVMVMYAGQVVEEAPTDQLFASVRMPYTKVLLDAIPRLERPAHTALPVVQGRPPDLNSIPVGCAFASRCPYVQDRCHSERPVLEEGEPDHRWACFFPVSEERPS